VSGTCKTCRWWDREVAEDSGAGYRDMVAPTDGATMLPMETEFDVGNCTEPTTSRFERPTHDKGMALQDGSNYACDLYTAESFGCVLYQEKNAACPITVPCPSTD